MSNSVVEPIESWLPRFGLSRFRPGQREVIESLLGGQDCLCVMPTGGGKSLCYQLPAVAEEGLTLVVSPLIALMKDQVDQLHSLGIRATFINSTLDSQEQQSRLDDMAARRYDLMYVVPERFRSPRFLHALEQANLRRFAIDEAHCISEWGHDFRPDYARLGEIRRRLGNPTTIALTATATKRVREDIVRQLQLASPRTFMTGFARENLHYEVQSPASQTAKDVSLAAFLRATEGSGIVYAATRKRCEEVAAHIQAATGRRVTVYHAGMAGEDRIAAQNDFMQGRVDVVVATNAFGMGIDKADVRFVVHYNLPGTLESYYQEAGRAGRDGKPSRCLLLYSPADRRIQEYFIESSYPSCGAVGKVYEFLRREEDDPIELTQEQIRERLGLQLAADGVGACLQLLEKGGVLERLDARQSMAIVRIDSPLPTLVDLLPKRAMVRRRVLRALERLVDQRRGELVYFNPREFAAATELEPTAVARALRELRKLSSVEYISPFRGRAIHMRERDKRFDDLNLDFESLSRRREAELEKLNRMVRFARSQQCRQALILAYFGDLNHRSCGHCDNCETGDESTGSENPTRSTAINGSLAAVLRDVLGGVASTRGHFGKGLVAQMLCGSNSKKVEKLGLHRLATHGLLKHLKQPEVVELIESLLTAGLFEQLEPQPYRPVLSLTALGEQTMREEVPFNEHLEIPTALARSLTATLAEHHHSTVPRGPLPNREIADRLRQWRRETAEQEHVPAYRVLTNATLDELAARLPTTVEALMRISGIGPAKDRRYGSTLLELLAAAQAGDTDSDTQEAASAEMGGPPSEPVVPAPPSPAAPTVIPAIDGANRGAAELRQTAADKSRQSDGVVRVAAEPRSTSAQPSHYWTWRMLAAGFTPEECSLARGLERAVVFDHALRAAEHGYPVSPEWFIAPSHLSALESLIGDETPSRIRPLLKQLPPGLRYEEIQLFLKCRESSAASS